MYLLTDLKLHNISMTMNFTALTILALLLYEFPVRISASQSAIVLYGTG